VWHDERMVTFAGIALRLVDDALRWLALLLRSTEAVRAENLFLRRQLALFIERGVRPRRVDAATRLSLVVLAKLFAWRRALVVVQPPLRHRIECRTPNRPSHEPTTDWRRTHPMRQPHANVIPYGQGSAPTFLWGGAGRQGGRRASRHA
jgi:hypothetical protein